MKKYALFLCTGTALVTMLMTASQANGQIFKKLKDKVADKIENKVDKMLDGSTTKKEGAEADADSQKAGQVTAAQLEAAYNFTRGLDSIYFDNFSSEKGGQMAGHWKTNGSGTIGTTDQFPGKWLFLNAFTSYKLKSDTPLPENFTVEFDIVTLSKDEAKDLESLSFGFAHNNAISNYISDAYNDGAITATRVHYWNKEIQHSSSDNKKHNTLDYPLEEYAIGKMHVAITVKGLHMQVFLDKHKVLDTDMFARIPEKKYFYISTSTRLDNGARIGVGNFKIAGL